MMRIASNDLLIKNDILFLGASDGQVIENSTARFERKTQHPKTVAMPLGAFSYSMSALHRCSHIGRYCSIAQNVQVFGDRHPTGWVSTSSMFYNGHTFGGIATRPADQRLGFDFTPKDIWIGDDVWIGQDVRLRDGITIGTGAVIAAATVVTKDVPPYTIVGGAPAARIRMRLPSDIIAELTRLEWWQYDLKDLQRLPCDVPELFCTALDAAINMKAIQRMPEERLSLLGHLKAIEG